MRKMLLKSAFCLVMPAFLTFHAGAESSVMEELAPYAAAIWNFDEGEGEKVLDSSGNENHGVMREGVTREESDHPASNGWVLDFDGEARWATYGYVEVPHSESLAFAKDSFTVSAWVYRGDETGGVVIGKGNPMASTGGGYRVRLLDRLRLQSVVSEPGRGGIGVALTSPNFFPPGAWRHVVQVFGHNGIDWSDSKLYIDGELLREASTAFGGSVFNEDPVRFGENLNGKIACIAVFNRALTGEEVKRLYGEGSGG